MVAPRGADIERASREYQQALAEVRDADAAMEELRRELARCEMRRSAANARAEAARARLNMARGRRSGEESPLLDAAGDGQALHDSDVEERDGIVRFAQTCSPMSTASTINGADLQHIEPCDAELGDRAAKLRAHYLKVKGGKNANLFLPNGAKKFEITSLMNVAIAARCQ
mmetsp:Transcript_55018/g.154355  ORF Transcript_55018/g.154355 Transcript_55018/m.154355 type:complete len:171 (+) Transcript_55018:155-667(+)